MNRHDILIIIAFVTGFLSCNFIDTDHQGQIERLEQSVKTLEKENKRLRDYRWAFINLADKCDTMHDGCFSKK